MRQVRHECPITKCTMFQLLRLSRAVNESVVLGRTDGRKRPRPSSSHPHGPLVASRPLPRKAHPAPSRFSSGFTSVSLLPEQLHGATMELRCVLGSQTSVTACLRALSRPPTSSPLPLFPGSHVHICFPFMTAINVHQEGIPQINLSVTGGRSQPPPSPLHCRASLCVSVGGGVDCVVASTDGCARAASTLCSCCCRCLRSQRSAARSCCRYASNWARTSGS